MSLLAILLALLVERYLGSLEELRRFEWVAAFADWVRSRLPATGEKWTQALPVLAAAFLAPLIGVALLGWLLWEVWGLFYFLFALFVLVYSLGPKDLEAQVEAFVDARERDDRDSAEWYAAELVDSGRPDVAPADLLLETIFVQAHERLFGVLFWFLLLGPAGALGYRLVVVLEARFGGEQSGFGDSVRRLHGLLAWLPARLVALGYALSGSFVEAMHYWRDEAAKWPSISRGVLVASGFGALRIEPGTTEPGSEEETARVREAMSLVRRTLLVWLAILALFVIAGWSH